jgi:hypothetical protein
MKSQTGVGVYVFSFVRCNAVAAENPWGKLLPNVRVHEEELNRRKQSEQSHVFNRSVGLAFGEFVKFFISFVFFCCSPKNFSFSESIDCEFIESRSAQIFVPANFRKQQLSIA